MRRIAGASPQQSHHGDDRKDGMARCEGHGFRFLHQSLNFMQLTYYRLVLFASHRNY
jgi:hypothetical protein